MPAQFAMRRTSLLCLAAAVLACQSFPGGELDEQQLTYADDADTNLKKGEEALESSDFTVAQRYFEYVKAKYPFLEAAKIAELRIADTLLKSDQHIEARDRYETFVRMHPTHDKVDYAAYKIAESHWLEAPEALFFLPPAYEKDLTGARNSVRLLQAFLRDYPKSPYREEAQKTLDEARRRLAENELYVAGFYEKRKQWPAVVNRLKTVVEQYPNLGLEADALWRLHAAYKQMNDAQGANDALKQIITRLPNTPEAERAQKLLGS